MNDGIKAGAGTPVAEAPFCPPEVRTLYMRSIDTRSDSVIATATAARSRSTYILYAVLWLNGSRSTIWTAWYKRQKVASRCRKLAAGP